MSMEKLRSMEESFKKATLQVAVFVLIVILCGRFLYITYVGTHFTFYLLSYHSYLDHTYEDVSLDDLDIMEKKLLPSKFLAILHPLKWTEKQISEDDDLLYRAKEIWNKEKMENEIKKEEATESFNQRYKKWTSRPSSP